MMYQAAPAQFSQRTLAALLELKAAMALEPDVVHVQVTYDDVAAMDVPPRVHVIDSRPWSDDAENH